jgi:hypothetical protein
MSASTNNLLRTDIPSRLSVFTRLRSQSRRRVNVSNIADTCAVHGALG